MERKYSGIMSLLSRNWTCKAYLFCRYSGVKSDTQLFFAVIDIKNNYHSKEKLLGPCGVIKQVESPMLVHDFPHTYMKYALQSNCLP